MCLNYMNIFGVRSGQIWTFAHYYHEQSRTSPNLMVCKYKAIMQKIGDLLTVHSLKTPRVNNISYCGLNEHHQNGKAERCVRDLQDHAMVLVMQAIHKWPEVITPNLLQYAVRLASVVQNHSPCTKNGLIPISTLPGQAEYPRSLTYTLLDVHNMCLFQNLTARKRLTGGNLSAKFACIWAHHHCMQALFTSSCHQQLDTYHLNSMLHSMTTSKQLRVAQKN